MSLLRALNLPIPRHLVPQGVAAGVVDALNGPSKLAGSGGPQGQPGAPGPLAPPPLQAGPMAAPPGGVAQLIIPGTIPIPRRPLERKAPNPGSGGSRSDDSSVTFDARAMLSYPGGMIRDQTALGPDGILEIDAGKSGHLAMFLTIEGFEDNLPIPIVAGNDSFTQEAEGGWDVVADLKGGLKITGGMHLEGPSDNDTDYTVQPIDSVVDAAAGTITTKVVVIGETTGSSTTVSGGGGGKVKGVEVNLGGERTKTSQKGPASVQETFTLTIKVVNIPKAPPPKDPTGTVKIKSVTAIVDGEFVVGPFVVGSDKKIDGKASFDPGSATHLKAPSVEKAVYDLFYSLPQGTRDSVANGKLAGDEAGLGMKIEIHAFASNTDSADRNLGLSTRRAQAVLNAFRTFGVPASAFQEIHPHGEWESRDDKGMEPTDVKKREKESPNWRKVVIKMRYTVTTETGE